jgi:hypothetical protein
MPSFFYLEKVSALRQVPVSPDEGHGGDDWRRLLDLGGTFLRA